MTTTMAPPALPTGTPTPAKLGHALPHHRISKPWGWEEIWAETPHYCGKRLFIETGRRLSLQYHDQKLESQCLISGQALLLLEDEHGVVQTIAMEPGVGYTIAPNRRHRLIAVENATVIEVSTPEIGITYRLEDDYDRPDETEADRAAQRYAAVAR